MSRRQAICYLVILLVLALALLVVLAIIQPLLMLLALLLLVIGAGLLKKHRPQLFAVFRKPTKDPVPYDFGSTLSPKKQYSPNLILVAGNLNSVGQIVIDFQIMIVESVVLFRVQYF